MKQVTHEDLYKRSIADLQENLNAAYKRIDELNKLNAELKAELVVYINETV
jgi:hypothetical protein|tara:strand:- start:1718 stop:1870 length:153 start_codon:yes stop_codon:yes gene_type:complete